MLIFLAFGFSGLPLMSASPAAFMDLFANFSIGPSSCIANNNNNIIQLYPRKTANTLKNKLIFKNIFEFYVLPFQHSPTGTVPWYYYDRPKMYSTFFTGTITNPRGSR